MTKWTFKKSVSLKVTRSDILSHLRTCQSIHNKKLWLKRKEEGGKKRKKKKRSIMCEGIFSLSLSHTRWSDFVLKDSLNYDWHKYSNDLLEENMMVTRRRKAYLSLSVFTDLTKLKNISKLRMTKIIRTFTARNTS